MQVKKPSIYYRTKVRPGEIINTFVVIENDESFQFLVRYNNEALGTGLNSRNKNSLTVDFFYSVCIDYISSADFSVNTKMCDSLKTLYGYGKILYSISYRNTY